MFFCPTCGNLLLIDQAAELGFHFLCQTCDYHCTLRKKITKKQELTLKKVDEVRGGKAEWEAVPKTQGRFILGIVYSIRIFIFLLFLFFFSNM